MTSEEGNLSQVDEVKEERPCNCPDRALPPDTPTKMPYKTNEESLNKLKE